MRVIWTFFWTFVLMQMLTYVVSSMNGISFNFTLASILGLVVTILIMIVGAIIPDEPVKHSHH